MPTVVWIDADGTNARPNASEVGTDLFAEMRGVSSAAHMDLVRAWVREGAVPEDSDTTVADLDDREIEARLAFRVAVHLRRSGDERSAAWFARAAELAPLDFTIRRASMPLTGVDPFGEEFFTLYEQWQEGGRPFHGITRR